MNKKWNLIPSILNGDKTIESRWYMAKFAPWNKIFAGDTVYFKDAGMPVTAKATVIKVLQFANLSEAEIKEILKEYAGVKKINFTSTDLGDAFAWAKSKKYILLIFLENPVTVAPFNINKDGFGNACAWLCVENISKVRI